MLRRFRGANERSMVVDATVEQLATARRKLLQAVDGNLRTQPGYEACSAFLGSLETGAQALHIGVASRAYRTTFSASYRQLFPNCDRHYRVDVLEASVDARSEIWVNGVRFYLSADSVSHADALQQAWTDLGSTLDQWSPSLDSFDDTANTLTKLDNAWACFEEQYIGELMRIEVQARDLLVNAIREEDHLRQLEEETNFNWSSHREALGRLTAHISRLNSVANCSRKGRDDLSVGILESALLALGPLRNDDVASQDSSLAHRHSACAACTLAVDVADTFVALRSYLRNVSKRIEKVDPHLCNNAGLVAHLADWEESWEIGARYVWKPPMLSAISDLVTELQAVQRIAPGFATMWGSRDPELFLVLPRVICLFFAAGPSLEHVGVFRSLLPHRFGGDSGECPDPELQALVERYTQTLQLVSSGMIAHGGSVSHGDDVPDSSSVAGVSIAEANAWDILVRRAVDGSAEAEAYESLVPELRHDAQFSVEDFMRKLERWSLELQRHCPEDWNQCCAVLVKCLTGEPHRQRNSDFRV